MHLLTIVGARPQFIKAAMVSRAIAEHNRSGKSPLIHEQIIHTGQHYDPNMSDIFFRQMAIPEPAVNLNVGSGSHGAMTAQMLDGIEHEILSRKPDWLLVYGDTNSTLAGALAAAKLHIPVAHVEAGLRSFNKAMPEEINRILTDHVSSLLFCPTRAAVDNLARENINNQVHQVGDVMYDAALLFADLATRQSKILQEQALTPGKYILTTVHRAENTDDPARLQNILTALKTLAGNTRVIFPVHPRTRAKLEASHSLLPTLTLLPPLSFLDMVMLEKHASVILTDSGGVQKEAYFHNVPCVTLRNETEWVETVTAGWNQIVGDDPDRILAAVTKARKGAPIPDYGTGHSANQIVERLIATPLGGKAT